MKISLITVCYNSAQHIQAAIESVLSQTYSDIEYIVVDGGSTDTTVDSIKSCEPQFKGRMHWISEPDTGIYDAMNKGIARATGEIIGFLNSDDIFFNEKIVEEVAALFEKNDCDMVYGDLIYQKDGKTIRRWKSNPFLPHSLNFGWMPPHPTLYCKRTVYTELGVFDSTFRLAADYDFMLRIFKTKHLKASYLPKVMIRMNLGGVSNANLPLKYQEDYAALKKNGFRFPFGIIFLKNIRKIYQFFRST
ncbi:MAG: glycosyltransferase [Candidatus Symbiothrix sp.]|jgi:glycosyltransferase|nr:glycosyltransferase [Candidatus Symbiothrix sp.]